MQGVRLGSAYSRSNQYVELHSDQERAVLMLLGDEPATEWLLEFLNARRGVATVLATAAWLQRKRKQEIRNHVLMAEE
jgi:hypothetical protein